MIEVLDNCVLNYKEILQAIDAPIAIVNDENIICYWNKSCERLTGFKAEEILGQPYNSSPFLPEPENKSSKRISGIKTVLKDGISATWKGFIIRKNGQRVPVESKISPIRDTVSGKIIGAIGILHDISVLASMEQTMKDMLETSRLDHLTGINNRHSIDAILESEIERSQRYNQPLALVMLDLDDFKGINDNYGHETGDLVLRETGSLLNFNLRMPDSAGRWGGEEFIILLPGSNLEKGRMTAERIREYIATIKISNVDRGITASLGVSQYDLGMSTAELVSKADEAMYQAKQNGKNQVCIAK